MSMFENRLMEIIANIKVMPVEQVQLSAVDDFLAKYDFDSMDAVVLSTEISQAFGVQFGADMKDIDSLQSFGSLVNRVQELQTEPARAA